MAMNKTDAFAVVWELTRTCQCKLEPRKTGRDCRRVPLGGPPSQRTQRRLLRGSGPSSESRNPQAEKQRSIGTAGSVRWTGIGKGIEREVRVP